MELKKNPKADLESKRHVFLQIGLIISLLAIFIAFEWKSYEKVNYNLGDLNLGCSIASNLSCLCNSEKIELIADLYIFLFIFLE